MLATALLQYVPHAVDVLAAPDPGAGAGNLNTTAILTFIASKIAPILVMAVGVIVISRAGKGEVSKVLTSTGILILGLIILGGGGALMLFGNALADLAFGKG
jgi:hypothetical protein